MFYPDIISTDNLNRRIFSRMVTEMLRDPAESLLVIATWHWLTQLGFPNILLKIYGVSDVIINALADEAVLLLKSLLKDASDITRELSLTSCVLGVKISLHALCNYPTRAIARVGIKHVLEGLISRAVVKDRVVQSPTNSHSREGLRTLFLTFSRGFPVTREEVMGVFVSCFGDCVERVEMGNGSERVEKQCLYARLILKSASTIYTIMNERRVTKFRVNGKHIWARKYQIRE